jgi:hypothetical protein
LTASSTGAEATSSSAPAGAVGELAEHRAEQHRRQQVRQHHRGRGPGGADPVVGQHHQRDIAGARAERALRLGGEEAPGGGLAPPDLDRRLQHGTSIVGAGVVVAKPR